MDLCFNKLLKKTFEKDFKRKIKNANKNLFIFCPNSENILRR